MYFFFPQKIGVKSGVYESIPVEDKFTDACWKIQVHVNTSLNYVRVTLVHCSGTKLHHNVTITIVNQMDENRSHSRKWIIDKQQEQIKKVSSKVDFDSSDDESVEEVEVPTNSSTSSPFTEKQVVTKLVKKSELVAAAVASATGYGETSALVKRHKTEAEKTLRFAMKKIRKEEVSFHDFISRHLFFDENMGFVVGEKMIFRAQFETKITQGSLTYEQSWTNRVYAALCEKRDMDFAIIVEGRKIDVHKYVLIAHSTVFETMLQSEMNEAMTKSIEITDYSEKIIHDMLLCLYNPVTARDTVKYSNVYELFGIAHKYQIECLLLLTEQYMIANFTCENVYRAIQLAEMYENENILESALSFSMDNYPSILSHTPNFNELISHETCKRLLPKFVNLY